MYKFSKRNGYPETITVLGEVVSQCDCNDVIIYNGAHDGVKWAINIMPSGEGKDRDDLGYAFIVDESEDGEDENLEDHFYDEFHDEGKMVDAIINDIVDYFDHLDIERGTTEKE